MPDSPTLLPSQAPLAYGVFDQVEVEDRPAGEVYADHLDLMELADKAGFYCYHFSEHHGSPLSLTTSPGILMAAASQRTSRIRLGALVFGLPYHDPFRLANEISMLDQLTGGRLELGTGRGVSALEATYFGVHDIDHSREVYQEDLRIMLQMFTSDELSFAGKHHSYEEIPLWFHPAQRPYPPLWFPSSNEASIPFTAGHGLNTVMNNNFDKPRVKALVDLYDETWAAHKADPDRMNGHVAMPKVGLSMKVVVGATDAEAETHARKAYDVWLDHVNYLSRRFGVPGLIQRNTYDDQVADGTMLAGSPESVRQQMADLITTTGITYPLCSFAFGAMPNAVAKESMRLFADEIMPKLASLKTA
jgi:alkanesulfonate monooxygenase SsuD/methylene tetrahydromethanopterin reductase-like flavin-dependent oxidoreductase (luciferase family)